MSPGLLGGAGAKVESEIMDQVRLFTCLFVPTAYCACTQDPHLVGSPSPSPPRPPPSPQAAWREPTLPTLLGQSSQSLARAEAQNSRPAKGLGSRIRARTEGLLG